MSSERQIVRSRGGYRQQELNTIPEGLTHLHAELGPLEQEIQVLTNFVAVSPMKARQIYQYRVDFEPDIESIRLRKKLVKDAAGGRLNQEYSYDMMHDLVSGVKLADEVSVFSELDPRNHPTDRTTEIKITLKRVSDVASPFELIRIYNMNMKTFLRAMGYFSVSQTGAYVHPSLMTKIGKTNIAVLRGYKTSASEHENQILMNLDSVHKLIQENNVLQLMSALRRAPNFREVIKAQLTGKLVLTNYNKVVYKIEDVNFDVTPSSTFRCNKRDRDITYLEYYQTRYTVEIKDARQPMLLVVPNNTRRKGDVEEVKKDIYLVPELCNIAGLTDEQRNDNRLKTELIRASQIPPADRVAHLRRFLEQLHADPEVPKWLEKWGYNYGKEPVKVKARILKTEKVGVGPLANGPPANWPKVDHMGSFESLVTRQKLAMAPEDFGKMAILISRTDSSNEAEIMNRLQQGFSKVGLAPGSVEIVRMREGDSAHLYVQHLRNLDPDVRAALVVLPRQNKERYDAVKKLASVERGLITQVVTTKLITDERKASGAAIKIGIQVAAKVGGEPWYAYIPLQNAMICGYDTYRDTAHRGRSYGAFLASMSRKYSQWYSRVDTHDAIDELSSHLAENLGHAMHRYKEVNSKFPERVFIYRDGVGDGQLPHVYNIELKQIRKVISDINGERTTLTFIVVNKRVGARFYMCNNNSYINPPPGSVIDSEVTRKERYDFYLISQSTRNGTVAPTYYNILQDDSGFDASKQQQLAYKLCFLYYNWTGTVRVPAPCQYAHKLALLCGEHLHDAPNAQLENNLHFL